MIRGGHVTDTRQGRDARPVPKVDGWWPGLGGSEGPLKGLKGPHMDGRGFQKQVFSETAF